MNALRKSNPKVFPVVDGKWQFRFKKKVGLNPIKAQSSFQAKLSAKNSKWLVVTIGNIYYHVKNHLRVPLQDITWLTIDNRAGIRLIFQDMCVW